MRKHGWQLLTIHSRQVVAVAVFLALRFAFYVFFAPFVGKQLFHYIVMGIYTPLFFRSKKYFKTTDNKKLVKPNIGPPATDVNNKTQRKSTSFVGILALLPCAYVCNSHDESRNQQSEDGMFYCNLCQVEIATGRSCNVSKYSKHCRVCDKCVDCFDHHCRWLNNCIGKRNYRKFFTLLVSALLLRFYTYLCTLDLRLQLILQWSTGVVVLIMCFLDKKKFTTNISSKLGSSFTVVPFVIVVAVCTILAMIATLPLAQLCFFHILLIKKCNRDITQDICNGFGVTNSCGQNVVGQECKFHSRI
ncbi:hypothetical protein OROGR_000461 [Orobanche gracilis]